MITTGWHKLQALAHEAMCARAPGQTNVEYALVLLLVAVAVAGALNFVGGQVTSMMTGVNGTLYGRIPV
jgi:Flp pilus assembly pilin Flp